MKLLLLIALAFGVVTSAQEPFENAPYHPKLRQMIEFQSVDGQKLRKTARATWDGSYHGGLSTASIGLGVYLPKNAMITRSFIHVITQQTYNLNGSAPQTAIKCEDAGNIKAATNITGTAADGFVEGESTGAASTFKSAIAAKCQISVDFSVAPVSNGKFEVFVDYVVTKGS